MDEAVHLSDRDLTQLAQVIHARAGITLGPEKRTMIEARLAKLVRKTGRAIGDVLRRLETDDDVMDDLLNVLTTNYTTFFRESQHFTWLVDSWLAPRKAARLLRVWCAACATGEEAYSLAITLREGVEKLNSPATVELAASDLSLRALDVAKAGVYPGGHVASMDPARVRRWFQRGVGSSDGTIKVKPELRNPIRFGRHNLLATAPFEGLDLIFLRNVLIYFDDPTQAQVIANMRSALAPGGFLVVGHAENVRRMSTGFRLHGHTILEKV
ncbi:MAG: protein-glutamate O-methyltransferase CheR [Deltaproteobacteria bacterium]|nr:protein-glutamate O-methyltransferase CheR [Deltaproteobacteria bacterium]